jgi:hypothetical protein
MQVKQVKHVYRTVLNLLQKFVMSLMRIGVRIDKVTAILWSIDKVVFSVETDSRKNVSQKVMENINKSVTASCSKLIFPLVGLLKLALLVSLFFNIIPLYKTYNKELRINAFKKCV